MADTEAPQAPGPKRFRGFLFFFRGYMGLWSVVTAALPIPVTYAGAIPVYGAQKAFLATYTSLFCFLVLGFIFYSRHFLARHMFPEPFRESGPKADAKKVGGPLTLQLRLLGIRTWNQLVAVLPLALILGCVFSVYQYHQLLVASVYGTLPESDFLQKAELRSIHSGSELMLYYLLIFLTAECAFTLMALKEYLQDLLGFSDLDVIRGRSALP